MTDDELRLNTDTYAETVLHLAFFEVCLAEIGHRSVGISNGILVVHTGVIAVIESIDTATDSEDTYRHPVSGGFESCYAEETLTVDVILVVILLGAARAI